MKKIICFLLCIHVHFCFAQNLSFFKDLNPVKTDAFSTISQTIVYKGELYFFITTQTYGNELWKTDGTVAGTSLVKDIIPGAANTWAGSFVTIFDNHLFFIYRTPETGYELWQTDGTAAGTKLFFEARLGAASGFYGNFEVVTSNIPIPVMYFSLNDSANTYSLYKYNKFTPVPQKFYSYTNTTSASSTDPFIKSLYPLNNKLLFFRHEAGSYSGLEPWVTNGTKHGTMLLKNINLLTGNYSGSQTMLGARNYFMGQKNNYAFFNAMDTANGYELWRTNGTTSGTTLVKDINPGVNSSLVNNNTGAKLPNGNILFPASMPGYGTEPWVTDGTSAGTHLVKDISMGTGSSYAGAYYMTTFQRKAIIIADDNIYGPNPYITNGTDTGTYMIQDVFPSSVNALNALYFIGGSLPNGVTFTGRDSLNNSHLFITDGIPGAVATITTYNPKNIDGIVYKPGINSIGVINNKLLYRVNYSASGYSFFEYYITDGTSAGTMPINFDQVLNETSSSYPSGFTKYNGEWFFTANNGMDGTQMWKTDGTVGGTFMFKNLKYSSLGVNSISSQSGFNEINGGLYFLASGKFTKYTGGSSANFFLAEQSPPVANSGISNVYKAGQQLFFTRSVPVNGTEPWRFNGTTATMMEINITNNCNPNNIHYCSSSPSVKYVKSNGIIFTANQDDGRPYLYRYTGSNFFLKIADWYQTQDILLADTSKYFYYSPTSIHSSYIQAGSGAHTTVNSVFDSVAHVIAYNSSDIYFAAKSATGGYQLWRSDGTVANTSLIKVINPGGNAFEKPANTGMNRTSGAFLNNNIFFFANDGVNGNELWKSDGTAAGTVMVKNINPTGSSKANFFDLNWGSEMQFIRMDNKLYFIADDGVHGYEVWVTDGTSAGTHITVDLNPAGSAFSSAIYNPYPATGYQLPFTLIDSIFIFNAFNGFATEAYYIDKATSSVKLFDINNGYPDNFAINQIYSIILGQSITVPELGLMTAFSPQKGYELYKYSVTPPPNPGLVCAVNSGCSGDSLTISYSVNSRLNPGNIITLQMSDASGSFTLPVNLATFTLSSGSQTFAVPPSTLPGNNYRFRLTTSNPPSVLPDNGTDIVIASAPQITNCVDSIVVNAQPGVCGAYVNYNFTAIASPQGETDYSKAPNSLFPIGTTPVYFTAWNGCGYDSCHFTVVVHDSINPVITCPADITTATSVVTYAAIATDNCGTPVVSFTPPSGTSFPLGTTVVTATATDSSGNTTSCQFAVNITVLRLAGQNTQQAIQQQFEVSPVPANQFLNIAFNVPTIQNINIKIKDVTGVVRYTNDITTLKGNNSTTLKTENLPGGIYIVELTGNNLHAVQKVLFQK